MVYISSTLSRDEVERSLHCSRDELQRGAALLNMSGALLAASWSLALSPGVGLSQRVVRSPSVTARSHSVMCSDNIFPGDELDEIGRTWLPPKPTWVEAVLDNGDAYWWRDVPGSSEPEVRFTDPSATPSTVGDAVGSTSPEWTKGLLDSGDPYWWRDSDAEDDGIEISLSEPDVAAASQ